jgi:hypothetical protein
MKQLMELLTHPGWEVLARKCLGGEGSEGLGKIFKEDLDNRMRTAMSREKYNEARYYQGQIELLERMFAGDLIDTWIEEFQKGE